MWTQFVLLLFLGTNYAQTYDLGGVLSGNRMGAVPLGPTLGDGELDVEGICSAPGPTCQDCGHVVMCVALPVGWLKVPLTECGGNETCNSRLGGCSATPVPECENATLEYYHVCEQVGIFPDAFDCRKFHLCSPPAQDPVGRPAEHRAALCPRHYAYDPHTAQCSIKLKYGQCEQKPVPDCLKIGQSDVLPGSPNHYYICLSKQNELYPQIFICPHGWFFWGGYCRPEPQPKIDEDVTSKQESVIPLKDFNVTTTNNDAKENKSEKTEQNNEVEIKNTVTQQDLNEEESNAVNPDTSEEDKVSVRNEKDPGERKSKNKRAKQSSEESEENSGKNYRKLNWFQKPKRYPADTFLADRYDLSHLEVENDPEERPYYDNENSFEHDFGVLDD